MARPSFLVVSNGLNCWNRRFGVNSTQTDRCSSMAVNSAMGVFIPFSLCFEPVICGGQKPKVRGMPEATPGSSFDLEDRIAMPDNEAAGKPHFKRMMRVIIH